MSLILDALKKLEQEKAARRDGTVNIAAEILRPDRLYPKNKRIVLFTIAAGAVGLAAIAVLALMGGSDGLIMRYFTPAPVIPPAAPQMVTLVIAPPAQSPQKPKEPSVTQSRTDIENVEVRSSVKPTETRASQPPAVSRTQPADKATQKTADASKSFSDESFPSLKVSGIVWQEERNARRAFVNGIIALEGAVIDGARVIEIYPTRVRFSRGGKSFEAKIENTP
jgi:general secretion pathway protein B